MRLRRHVFSKLGGTMSLVKLIAAMLAAFVCGFFTNPVTRNRSRDHLITARILQSDALPTEL